MFQAYIVITLSWNYAVGHKFRTSTNSVKLENSQDMLALHFIPLESFLAEKENYYHL